MSKRPLKYNACVNIDVPDVSSLCFSPTGDKVAIGSDATTFIYDTQTGNSLYHVKGSASVVFIQWFPENCLYLGFDDGELLSVSVDRAFIIDGFLAFPDKIPKPVEQFSVHPNGQKLVAAGGETLYLWSRHSASTPWQCKRLQPPSVHSQSMMVRSIVFLSWVDNHLLIVFRHHGVTRWNPLSQAVSCEFPISGPVLSADISPDEHRLVVSTPTQFQVIDLVSNSLVQTFSLASGLHAPQGRKPAIFVHNGKSVLCGQVGSASMMHVESGARQRQFSSAGQAPVLHLAAHYTEDADFFQIAIAESNHVTIWASSPAESSVPAPTPSEVSFPQNLRLGYYLSICALLAVIVMLYYR